MRPKKFLSQLDEQRIVSAIGEAESRTSGEIRVWISQREIAHALETAQERFHKLDMHKTEDRNAVLLYIAPRTQVFAVIGDKAVHEKCGDAFWSKVTTELTAGLKRGAFTEAIIHAVQLIGNLLGEHFPRKPGDKNELPDDVLHD